MNKLADLCLRIKLALYVDQLINFLNDIIDKGCCSWSQ
jgi:hypothetical protein